MRKVLLNAGLIILLMAFLAGCSTTEYHEKKRIIEQHEIIQ